MFKKVYQISFAKYRTTDQILEILQSKIDLDWQIYSIKINNSLRFYNLGSTRRQHPLRFGVGFRIIVEKGQDEFLATTTISIFGIFKIVFLGVLLYAFFTSLGDPLTPPIGPLIMLLVFSVIMLFSYFQAKSFATYLDTLMQNYETYSNVF